jgi:hypothetical protein
VLRLRRTGGDQVVRRLLDPAYEDEVFEQATQRTRLEVASVGTIAMDDPRRSVLTEHLEGTERAASAKGAAPAVGRIAAADPRRSVLTEHLEGTERAASAKGAAPAVGRIAPADPRRSVLTEHLEGTERAASPRAAAPAVGTIAPADPRRSVLTEHLQGTERAASPRVAGPAVSKIAANDPRLDPVEANLILIRKRKEAEEAKAKEAAREQAFQQFVTTSNLVLSDQTESYAKKLRLNYKRWVEAKAVGEKKEILETKADLDRFATVDAKRDRDEKLLAAQIAAREKQKAEYDQRFTSLVALVPTKVTDPTLRAEVVALLRAVKAEIDLINTKGGNVSSNFAADLQASAKGTFTPLAIAIAGPAWSTGCHRFAPGDQKYRGPHQKGGQSLAAATVDLPQANFEAPISVSGTGKINVHVSAGAKSGGKTVDAYTIPVDAASQQTHIHPAEIIRMAKYYKDDPQPLGVVRKGKSYFSSYDITLLSRRHQTVTGQPWNNTTT